MNFLTFLYNIIIAPIEMIIEFVFVFAKEKIKVGGIFGSIITVSLVVNFLALPLYNIADNLQKKERDIQIKMSKWLSHIKKTFTGDERFMMIQAYYRQNGYHPLYALRSSLSVLIEIPFFIAAYHFLSNSPSLKGAGFAFFSDLGSPDRLLHFSLFGKEIFINVLPILMTFINIFSGIVYLKNAPLREKVQVYGLAALFLVILYNSPCGLVLYWILNNLFSLLKNIVNEKLKNPRKFVFRTIAVIFLAGAIGVLTNNVLGFKKRIIFFGAALVFALVIFGFSFIKRFVNFLAAKFNQSKNVNTKITNVSKNQTLLLLLFSGLGLSILAGFLLPSEVIAASPIEFSFIEDRTNPNGFVLSCFSLYLGLFTFWPLVIYNLFGEKVKRHLPYLWAGIFILALLNSFVFRHHFGTMSVFSILDSRISFAKHSFYLTYLPFFVFAFVVLALILIKRFNFQKYLSLFLIVICCSETIFATINACKINKEFKKYEKNIKENSSIVKKNSQKKLEKVYHLSKDKENVIVLFLDRGIPSLIPYVLKEFPELEDVFSGFKLFENTVSFSDSTIKASPALMGGYEYTPENINKRSNELLVDKHNEATLVMPKLFLDAGFNATVTNLPLPNYSWTGDLSFYKKYPEIQVYDIGKEYASHYFEEHPEIKPEKQVYCIEGNLQSFALLEIIPPFIREMFYLGGKYFRERIPFYLNVVPSRFMEEWSTLYYLPEVCDTESEKPSFIFIDNETTHEPCILENHTYLPKKNLDKEKATCGGGGYGPNELAPIEYYHVTATTMLQLAKWMTYLKEQGVYNNTRIIFVGDHGKNIPLPIFRDIEYGVSLGSFNCLLMYKDFNATGKFKIDSTFMTNADTVILATQNLAVSKQNPFTHNNLKDFVQKDDVHIFPCLDTNTFREFDSYYMLNKTQFILEDKKSNYAHYTVHTNIFDKNNWQRIVD